jgi:hypothetical protein
MTPAPGRSCFWCGYRSDGESVAIERRDELGEVRVVALCGGCKTRRGRTIWRTWRRVNGR